MARAAVESFEVGPGPNGAGWSGSLVGRLAPILLLIGAAPALVLQLLEPGSFTATPLSTLAGLMPPFVIAGGLFAFSAISPGEIAGLAVHPSTRTLDVIECNFFAERRTQFAFAEIADIAIRTSYDEDGYAQERAVLTLRSGATILLPESMDQHDVSTVRGALIAR